MSPKARVREALKEALIAAENANSAANHLAGVILTYWPSLAAESTLVRSTATLLQHVSQHFGQIYVEHLKQGIRNPRKVWRAAKPGPRGNRA
jgi:hypothetical protein